MKKNRCFLYFYDRLQSFFEGRLKAHLSHSSIRSKLIFIVMGVTCGILLLAVLSQSILHYVQTRERILSQNENTARIVGHNILTAQRNNNDDFIWDVFEILAYQSPINMLCFFGSDGQPEYRYPPNSTLCQNNVHKIDTSNSFLFSKAMEPLVEEGETLGYMFIQYDMTEDHAAYIRRELIALIPVIISMILAYIMANAMQRFITRPIEGLAHSLEAITLNQSYDHVLHTDSKDEVGKLINAFNNLIRSIRTHEKQLLEVNRKLEEANKSKDHFLANMSHELRTPLNSIIGHVRILMQENDIPKDHKATLSIVDKSSVALLEIVNDVLDISKIEEGKIALVHKPFNIAGLLYSALDQMTPLAEMKGLKIISNEHDLPLMNLVGDQFRLSRILLNLLSNAVKYTFEGYVEVNVQLCYRHGGKVEFICNVSDSGVGIPENKLDCIFDKFTQVEDTTERSFGGTGLGLNITKHLVTLMGGDISVRSEVGVGSCFEICIPFEPVPYDDQVPVVHAEEEIMQVNQGHIMRLNIEEAKILVAEDQEFNQLLIMKMLKRAGAQHIILTGNGEEVINAFKRERPDIILMDCHMPIIDGYAATRAIRHYEQKHMIETGVPILALTADAMAGARDAVMRAGMDEYLSKPIDERLLRKFLKNWFVLDNASASSQNINDQAARPKNGAVPPADLSILYDYTDGDEDVQKELIGIFCSKTLNDLQLLQDNMTEGENIEWSETAHKLKGSAGYIGAMKLRELCDQGQAMIIATRKQRRGLYEEIISEHTKICEYLKSKNLL